MDIIKILNLLNKIVPKKNIILFSSFPDFDDNAYQIYIYIRSNRRDLTEKYNLIWLVNDESSIYDNKEIESFDWIRKKSIKGIFYYLVSKYVVYTHGYAYRAKSGNGQIHINVWHGCGYKKGEENHSNQLGDMAFISSDVYRKSSSEAFFLSENKIYTLGIPRNDLLFHKINSLALLGVDRNHYSKIFIWMPTYRKRKKEFGTKTDGNVESFGISAIDDMQVKKLNNLLVEKKYLLLIKPHPMDSVPTGRESSNIVYITNDIIKKSGTMLYNILPETDILISDYSSVVIDYMLLNKPIAMAFSDEDSYEKTRGLIFTPLEEYLPGPILHEFDELFDYFDNCDYYNEKWKGKREELTDFFHKYRDGNSCKRIVDFIWGEDLRLRKEGQYELCID